MCESSTASSIAQPPAASVETTPSRWGFQPLLLPLTRAFATAVVVFGVICGSPSKTANAAMSQGQNPPQNNSKQGGQAACDSGDAGTCNFLGKMYATGLGTAKDENHAAQLFQESCEAGNAEGCNFLGTMYEAGRGVTKDERRAVELYQKSCDGGLAFGCGNLGSMYWDGRGVAKDKSRAVQFHQEDCDLGGIIDCDNGKAVGFAGGSQKPSGHLLFASSKAGT